jgi:starch synthase
MNILYVSAELNPFSKVGGLGDVAAALPEALARKGLHVRILTPAYGSIPKASYRFENTGIEFDVWAAGKSRRCSLKKWQDSPHPNLEVYFLENNDFFASRSVYTDKFGRAYPDNPERFILFSKAALEAIVTASWPIDLVHCNDNHSALLPVYLRVVYPQALPGLKTLLTIHNIAYQGVIGMIRRDSYDLPDALFYPTAPMEWYGTINPLKAGIIFADGVNTVSMTHASEIASNEELSAGLKNVINTRSSPVRGILNGVDYSEWDPSQDIHLAQPYSAKNLPLKVINKKSILEELQISNRSQARPLVGMISRLVEQKGIELLLQSLDRMMAMDISLAILGTGEGVYHRRLQSFAERHPERLRLNLVFDNDLSHRIIAGSDLFLMPSRFEPCGITQMYSLRYGTIPVVHQTGGLADTVIPWDSQKGNGFCFSEYTSDAFIQAICEALHHYQNSAEWQLLMQSAMGYDFSWDNSAEKYIQLYQELVSG